MLSEASVSDPFPVPDAPGQQKLSEGDISAATSPGTQGLDVTGASISSVTGEDGNCQVNIMLCSVTNIVPDLLCS